MFTRRKSAATTAQEVDPRAVFGPDFTATLVTHLGPERLAGFTETVLADARDRWSRRDEKDESGELRLLSREQMEEITRGAEQQGLTLKQTAAAIHMSMGRMVVAQAVLVGIQWASLPAELCGRACRKARRSGPQVPGVTGREGTRP